MGESSSRAHSRRAGASAGTPVTSRMRKADALPVVIRTWRDERRILDAIHGALPNVPRCRGTRGDEAVHSSVQGVPLSSICPAGKPVDARLITALAGLLADMTRVPRKALPPLPPYWPGRGGESGAFLRALARAADEQIRQPNWAAFGGLFASLGVTEDCLSRFAAAVPTMTRRPFSLLHADLHRDNVIVPHEGESPLVCVNWGRATYGDPLYDLATHLVRMDYPDEQWTEVKGEWRAAMRRASPDAVKGLDTDLRHYVGFEYAQSVFADVVRAATSLGEAFGQRDLDEAAEAVAGALVRARKPLRLRDLPDVRKIEPLLYRWRVAKEGPHRKDSHRKDQDRQGMSWRRDARVPEHADFPGKAVVEALWAEGGATADQVFKGTAHLGTVVRVPEVGFPVMVRRKVTTAGPREARFLDEHAVLRAIEESGVAVRAPRVLALGFSDCEDQFSIHSFEGPADTLRPPRHPESGLLPYEADDLVDQLAALTRVDVGGLDRQKGHEDFYGWLSHQLVRLVDGMPKETKQLAVKLGLPGARWLEVSLGRHTVTPRGRVLLHGDLNPWNLVRRPDRGGLTLIDWEMAMVGDPLYDLVRHMHLTPTKPEISRRMYARWTLRLPGHLTAGLRSDVLVYRSIEKVRSAYVDLDRLVTGEGLDAPNVQRAVASYTATLRAALAWLGRRSGPANPCLPHALPTAGART